MPTENEKQITAMMMLREKLLERKNATLELIKTLGNKDMPTQIEDGLLAAYCDIIQDIDTELLPTERQQLIDAYGSDRTPCSEQDAIDYFEQTFNPQ